MKRLTATLREQQAEAAKLDAAIAFQLTDEECNSLGSQFATVETGRGRHRKYLPYAFPFDAIRELTAPPVRRRQIGFRSGNTS